MGFVLTLTSKGACFVSSLKTFDYTSSLTADVVALGEYQEIIVACATLFHD